jgi:ABC-type branched-subunit amino acid transport system ATPase component
MEGASPVVRGSWLKGLNTAQLAAATAEDPALIILAGVGVGKTTTLLARVADLVHWMHSRGRVFLMLAFGRNLHTIRPHAVTTVQLSTSGCSSYTSVPG